MPATGPRDWSPRWGKPRRFILKTELVEAGDWMPEEQECFVIEITPDYAKVLLARLESFMGVAGQDRALWEMYFWDSSGDYYGVDWEKTVEEYDEEGREIVVPKFDAPGRTEVDQLIVRKEELCWTAMPKHGDVYTVTDAIKWHEIRQIAAEKNQGGEA
jgi:hypothetical protein